MRPELLAPAGDLDTVRTAFRFGADAVYLGGDMLQLRSAKTGFSLKEIGDACRIAHRMGKRIYVTLNAFARGDEPGKAADYALLLREQGADAVIISDPGVMTEVHSSVPELPIHLSTQANCTNAAAARVWHSLGASRIVPARELSLNELILLGRSLPEGMELETFVHGAMCMAWSGRCMISAFLTGRSANRGGCTQPCRWQYTVREQSRPEQTFPVEEDENGMAIFSSGDLNMLPFLDRLVAAGIASFKIEGRMKSEAYVATVTGAYRRRLDDILEGRESDLDALTRELESTSHRPWTTGFYFGQARNESGDDGSYLSRCIYAAQVDRTEHGHALIRLRNRFSEGDPLEAVTPRGAIPFSARGIREEDGTELHEAAVPDRLYLIDIPAGVEHGDLIRRVVEPQQSRRTEDSR